MRKQKNAEFPARNVFKVRIPEGIPINLFKRSKEATKIQRDRTKDFSPSEGYRQVQQL